MLADTLTPHGADCECCPRDPWLEAKYVAVTPSPHIGGERSARCPHLLGATRLAGGVRDPSYSLSVLVLPGRLERPHSRLGGGGSVLLSYGKLVV